MISRLRVVIRGAVQGVGFRPFVYRLATGMGLPGWVSNSLQGVFIEAEGEKAQLDTFLLRLEREKPPRSFIQSLEYSLLDPAGFEGFQIRPSDTSGVRTGLVLPDIATCPECRAEIFDPQNRRHLYPFTNCTHCGPRFSIIEALPYDRPNTSMKLFPMCTECRDEYENPLDRRFHAQPNACPRCGPHLELWDEKGRILDSHHPALLRAGAALRAGDIVAVKGLGGFHLMADARAEEPVLRLRRLKLREEKPLALMYPCMDLLARHCQVSELEERLLRSPESPIVLLQARAAGRDAIAAAVAPRNPYLGVMLPYTPLHHLLMAELGFPVVATSGNLSDEPICTDEREALVRLGRITRLFLVHNRPIVRHVDDSIARVMMGRELVLRRARGYAPLPVQLGRSIPTALAVGAHLKNTVAVSVGDQAFVSQHIGDLETPEAFDAFRRVAAGFRRLYALQPAAVCCDLHPGYVSSCFASGCGLPVVAVQHHQAHVLACMAENELQPPLLGVSWDGTGYGSDGTVWGGEFFLLTEAAITRIANLRPFLLPGGEKAIREPRRTALGLLWEIFGEAAFAFTELAAVSSFTPAELEILQGMLKKRINAPVTSSAGRLFDAVAAIAGLRLQTRFEGQAAMELEFALAGTKTDCAYPFDVRPAACGGEIGAVSQAPRRYVVDWAATAAAIVEDVRRGTATGLLSARFHNTLAEMIVRVAQEIGQERIALSGGCFQNRYLTERAVRRLQEEGFRPYWHQRIPPNDGGIALGQLAALARLEFSAEIADKGQADKGTRGQGDKETRDSVQDRHLLVSPCSGGLGSARRKPRSGAVGSARA